MSSLKSKFLYQLTASVLHATLPLITFPYISRVLGPEKVGAINFVDYTAQIFITLANFGIPLYAVREIAKVRNSPSGLQKIVSELLSIHLLSTFIGLLAFIFTMRLIGSNETGSTLVILACLNLFFNAFSLHWFVHGLEDFKALTIRSLGVKILVAVFTFLFIKDEQDYNEYYSLLIGGSFLLILWDIYYLYKKNVSLAFTRHIKKHIRPLFIFFLTSATFSIYTLLDTFILGLVTTTLVIGFYTTSLKIIRLFQALVNSLGGVLLPRIAHLIEQKDENEISRILKKSLLYVFTIAIPAGFLFYLLAPEIIKVLAGNQYTPSISAIQILSLLPLLIGLSNIFGIQVLIPFGKERQLLKAALIGSSVSIILCIILSQLFQEDGAAIATVFTELAVTLVMGIYANRTIKLQFPVKSFANIFITTLLFIPAVIAIRYIFSEDMVVLILSLFVCLNIYIVIQLYFFSNSILLEMLQFARSLKSNLKSSK